MLHWHFGIVFQISDVWHERQIYSFLNCKRLLPPEKPPKILNSCCMHRVSRKANDLGGSMLTSCWIGEWGFWGVTHSGGKKPNWLEKVLFQWNPLLPPPGHSAVSQTGPADAKVIRTFRNSVFTRGFVKSVWLSISVLLFTTSLSKPLLGIWVIPSWLGINHKGMVGFPFWLWGGMTQPKQQCRDIHPRHSSCLWWGCLHRHHPRQPSVDNLCGSSLGGPQRVHVSQATHLTQGPPRTVAKWCPSEGRAPAGSMGGPEIQLTSDSSQWKGITSNFLKDAAKITVVWPRSFQSTQIHSPLDMLP